MDGLILIGLLALLFTIFLTKTKRRLGFPVRSSAYAGTMVVFVIVVLMLWRSGQG